MHLCYIDESGCTGALPSATSDVQPVLVICGLVFNQADIVNLTREFIDLKRTFFPKLVPPSSSHFLDWMCQEIKGADLRKAAISSSRRTKRHAIGFLDKVVHLLEKYGCKLKGRVWVKGIGLPFVGRSVYTSSIQYVNIWFQKWLDLQSDTGMVICDSRNPALNANVSHSIFTQKFKAAGDEYPRILEMPTFGHSENHVGIQLGDIICSALLFPMAIEAYCKGVVTSTHVRSGYEELISRFGGRLDQMQYRIQDANRIQPRFVGGIMVDDRIGQKPRWKMFKSPVVLTSTPRLPTPSTSP